jgi:alkane 1-monooxygenase
VFSGWTMFHLQRHSDHHAHPAHRYQCLRHFDDLPALPSGYWGMFLFAWMPPLWFRLMDPRLVKVCRYQASAINFSPAKREKLIREYRLSTT